MELAFRIAFCSGEDLDYRSDELNPEKAAAGPRGWQTPRDAAFPMELGLELRAPGGVLPYVEQLKLLSHQSKIASRVELFVGDGPDYHGASFERLGYLSLASNERSQYQARELKTVYLNLSARFIKLQVHECHRNKYNVFNQVGIVAITLLGRPSDAQAPGEVAPPGVAAGETVAAEPKPMQAHAARAREQFRHAGLGEDLAHRIDDVGLAKQRAVEVEDYDAAKRLKQVEGLLAEMVRHYMGMVEDKFEAVAVEDYDRAKELKVEMEDFRELMVRRLGAIEAGARLEDVLAGPGGQAQDSPGTRHADSRELPTTQHHSGSLEETSDHDDFADSGRASRASRSSRVSRMSRTSRTHVDPTPESFEGHEEDGAEASYGTDGRMSADPGEASGAHGDEPEGPHPLEGVENCYDLPEPEALAAPEEFNAWVRAFGEYVTRCLRSSTWQLRDAALLKCAIEVPAFQGAVSELVPVTLQVVAHGLRDKIAQVAYSSLVLLRELVKACAREGLGHGQLREAGLDTVFAALSDKVGDGNARLRDQACSALLHMAASPVLGLGPVGAVCCRRMAKKQGQNPRSVVARLNLLRDLVESRGLAATGAFTSEHVLGFVATHEAFSHSNAQVRDAARELTVSVYALRGRVAVDPYLEKLRPKQVQEYEAAFELHNEVRGPAAEASLDGDSAGDAKSPENISFEGFEVNEEAQPETRTSRYAPPSASAGVVGEDDVRRSGYDDVADEDFEPVIPDLASDSENDDEGTVAARRDVGKPRPRSSASRRSRVDGEASYAEDVYEDDSDEDVLMESKR